jgi:hypothetical protein
MICPLIHPYTIEHDWIDLKGSSVRSDLWTTLNAIWVKSPS